MDGRAALGRLLAGWLYVLLRRRQEDGRQFALLLARRSLVARQLAHSRLAAARARSSTVGAPSRTPCARCAPATTRPTTPGSQRAIELMDGLVRALRLALDRGGDGAGAPAAQRRRTAAWIELVALRNGLALRVEPIAGHEVFALSGAALTPALAATLSDWARGQAGILRHGLEAAPVPTYVIHLAAD